MHCLTETMNQLVKNSRKLSVLHCKRNVTSKRSIISSVRPALLVSQSQQNSSSMSKNYRNRPRALVSSFLVRSLKTLCVPRSLNCSQQMLWRGASTMPMLKKITVLGGYGEVSVNTVLRANMAMSGTETGCVLTVFSQRICTEHPYGGRDYKSHLPVNSLKMVFPM